LNIGLKETGYKMQIIYNQELKEYTRKCSNQHDNSLLANHCRKCGEKLSSVNEFCLDYRPRDTYIKKLNIDEIVNNVWFIDNSQLLYSNSSSQVFQILFNDNGIPQKNILPSFELGNISNLSDLKNLYYLNYSQIHKVRIAESGILFSLILQPANY